MKQPKAPKNKEFWLQILKDEKKLQDFLTRGNPEQKKNIEKAIKYKKWLEIQERRYGKPMLF